MSVDMLGWRNFVKQAADTIADEDLQRRAWFGIGPEVIDPGEHFNQLFGDAAIEEFVQRSDSGLSSLQIEYGNRFVELMRKLSEQTPDFIDPHSLIDDPRWHDIRRAAKMFSSSLEKVE